MQLIFEQLLNGLQLGLMLFLLSAGLTLIFGIMGIINLAHGSLYMVGAYMGAFIAMKTGVFWLAVPGAVIGAVLLGMLLETTLIQKLYERDHLDQVLVTFGLILIFNSGCTMLFGRAPLLVATPKELEGFVTLPFDLPYSAYRLFIMAFSLVVAALLFWVVKSTKLGMLIRAGATNREMVAALGVNIRLLYTVVFGLGAALAALAGILAAPIRSVQIGMGEQILILTFVVIVVGGLGSIKGALVGSLLIGLVDTLGRAFIPDFFKLFMSQSLATGFGSSMASLMIYIVMALVLLIRPQGLFPENE